MQTEKKIIECVPNVSEGKNQATVEKLAAAATVTGASLADYSSDPDHNRSVFTIIGEPDAVFEAAFRLAQAAVETIDLNIHDGAHPRMGAVDVIPFIPLRGSDMNDCVQIAAALGKRLWNDLRLPVFLYEEAASAPHRKNLAVLRKGGFENMANKIKNPEFFPDYGDVLHKTAGITAVGARRPLIAFNVNLDTDDISAAKKIASKIRSANGGLPGVKAIGVAVKGGNTAQVSVNITDYTQTSMYKVLETVRFEAARLGVAVNETEIIGLAPMQAYLDCANYYLGCKNSAGAVKVIESHF
ncbi:MAG: glutamate formimidoyltransferase [Defluviitaleaceae bacterium]|nr:glutamate formimidoyltransferase [Defluviitaleaceae bacterium]